MIRILQCKMDGAPFDLAPTFFAAEAIEDVSALPGETRRQLYIRAQRGSDKDANSDGIYLFIRDANMVRRELLDRPIPLSNEDDALVRFTLYLNETCPAGFPADFRVVPTVLGATGGTIRFQSIYAPDINDEAAISASFENVVFDDPDLPESRMARLDEGSFSFFYQRGRPAQLFP